MPRYEFTGEGSSKFWEITLAGNSFTTSWGRLGTKGQSKTQQLADDGVARLEYEQLIASKVKKGYLLAGAAEPQPLTRTVLYVRLQTPEHLTRQLVEITLDGRVLKQRLVWNETELESKTEKFPTASQAQIAFDRAVAMRVKDEFIERERLEQTIDETIRVEPKRVSNRELEAAVLASPEDDRSAAVYADFLQAHGDLRGDLAALWVQGKTEAAAQLVERHRTFFWGRAADRAERDVVELEWRNGLLTGATLKPRNRAAGALDELVAQVLEAPLGAWLTSLRFGLAHYESNNDWSRALAAVTASPRAAQIEALRFDAYDSSDCELSWTPFGNLSDAWRHLPALELLKIRSGVGGVLGELVLPNLRTFIRESGGLLASELEAIGGARWPRLEHLEIWTGAGEYGAEGSVSRLEPILAATGLSKLRHLGIVNCEFSHQLLPALAESKLLPQLTSLDLSKGVLQGSEVKLLVKLAAAFAHLESIDLSHNQLPVGADAELLAVLPRARVGDQRGEDPDEEEAPRRYVAVGE